MPQKLSLDCFPVQNLCISNNHVNQDTLYITRGLTEKRDKRPRTEADTYARSLFQRGEREREMEGEAKMRRLRSKGGGTIYLRTLAALCQYATARRTTFLPSSSLTSASRSDDATSTVIAIAPQIGLDRVRKRPQKFHFPLADAFLRSFVFEQSWSCALDNLIDGCQVSSRNGPCTFASTLQTTMLFCEKSVRICSNFVKLHLEFYREGSFNWRQMIT